VGIKSGDGSGITDYTIVGEFSENGYKENTLSFERGTLGLARQDGTMLYYYTGDTNYLTQGYNSGCTQFFITVEDCSEQFDGYYCAFGKVIEGMEIVDTIKAIETTTEINEETGEKTNTTKPVNPPVITKMTVDTKGIEYNEPKKITSTLD
jgi:peptidyl-prolyl cis-trans isomerase B (cyclophilin B)